VLSLDDDLFGAVDSVNERFAREIDFHRSLHCLRNWVEAQGTRAAAWLPQNPRADRLQPARHRFRRPRFTQA
jgi:hypothetical protein